MTPQQLNTLWKELQAQKTGKARSIVLRKIERAKPEELLKFFARGRTRVTAPAEIPVKFDENARWIFAREWKGGLFHDAVMFDLLKTKRSHIKEIDIYEAIDFVRTPSGFRVVGRCLASFGSGGGAGKRSFSTNGLEFSPKVLSGIPKLTSYSDILGVNHCIWSIDHPEVEAIFAGLKSRSKRQRRAVLFAADRMDWDPEAYVQFQARFAVEGLRTMVDVLKDDLTVEENNNDGSCVRQELQKLVRRGSYPHLRVEFERLVATADPPSRYAGIWV